MVVISSRGPTQGRKRSGVSNPGPPRLETVPSVPAMTLSGWTVSGRPPVTEVGRGAGRGRLSAHLILGVPIFVATAAVLGAARPWREVTWPLVLLGALALAVQLLPTVPTFVNVSLGAGFLLSGCLLGGADAGVLVVAVVFLLWSAAAEWLPWLARGSPAAAGQRVARALFGAVVTTGIYLAAAHLTLAVVPIRSPVTQVSLVTAAGALILTISVYLLHHAVGLLVAALAREDVAAVLHSAVPGSVLSELLAAPASLLLAVTFERLGWGAFCTLAVLYLGTMQLAWRSAGDRERLERRLRDVELLHRAGEELAATLDLGELVRRLFSVLREVADFTGMFIILEDPGEGLTQVYAFDGEGQRGELPPHLLAETLGRPEGVQVEPSGAVVVVRDLPVGGAATARLRLDFGGGKIPDGHLLVLVDTVCRQAGSALGNARLYRLANTDPLTGLAIRRYFERALRQTAARGEEFSVIMLDLDRFKRVNDSLGHRAGDEILRDLAGVLEGLLRVMDVAGRYGGEEFVVLLPGAASPEAAGVAERIRRTLEQRRLNVEGRPVGYTASLGVAGSGEPPYRGDPMEVVWRADAALLEAKRAGRNQVVTAASLEQSS